MTRRVLRDGSPAGRRRRYVLGLLQPASLLVLLIGAAPAAAADPGRALAVPGSPQTPVEAALPAALPGAALASSKQAPPEATLIERRGVAMGTELQLRMLLPAGKTESAADAVFQQALALAKALDLTLSEWKPGSPMGKLNASETGGPVVFPAPAFKLLKRALTWSKRTGGAFDPSFASLWGLWRFDPGDAARVPSQAEAKAKAKLINYRKIRLNPRTRAVRLSDPRMKIGLGGIAKGYTVDRIVALLRAAGFRDFFVKFGGELYLGGTHAERPWVVGVQDPRDEARYFATLALGDSAFTTSGDYEHFLIKDGVRYHHIIDPATGYPARRARAVSVVAPDAESADALSTGLFVLGKKRALKLVNSLPGVEMVMVTGSGEVVVSKGLQGKIELGQPVAYEGP